MFLFQGVQIPCRGADADSHNLAVQQTIETPQLRVVKVVDAPVCKSCTSSFSCRDAEADPRGLVDHGDSTVVSQDGDRCPCGAGSGVNFVRVGRALCTGTGPGFDPRHQGGKGAGTPGVLTPICSATRIRCILLWCMDTHVTQATRPYHHPTHPRPFDHSPFSRLTNDPKTDFFN